MYIRLFKTMYLVISIFIMNGKVQRNLMMKLDVQNQIIIVCSSYLFERLNIIKLGLNISSGKELKKSVLYYKKQDNKLFEYI